MTNLITAARAKDELIAAKKFIGRRIKEFSFSDMMIYKATVFAFGTMFGAIFSKLLRKILWIFVLVAGLGAGYLVYKHFINED